jgi:CDP-4-dehydro-6-deoxyglucose reductase
MTFSACRAAEYTSEDEARATSSAEYGGCMMDSTSFVKPWQGIPRQDIDWHPTLVADRCIGCGLCVTSCGRQVYGFDYEQNTAVVANPLNCMVGCTTCATICAQDAIEFPSLGYIRHLIRERKVLRRTKDQIKANRDQYAVQLRAPVLT